MQEKRAGSFGPFLPSGAEGDLANARPAERAPSLVDDNAVSSEASARGVQFGFSGPEDRVVSLNIPAMGENGQNHDVHSFDIQFDPEQPDMIAISFLALDKDNFIHTIQESVSFPARLLAELLSRRKATAQEIAAWAADSDEEDV